MQARRGLLYRLGRLWARFVARRRGLAWQRCPLCGAWFGGHESRGPGLPVLWNADGSYIGTSVCPPCSPIADAIALEQAAERWPDPIGGWT